MTCHQKEQHPLPTPYTSPRHPRPPRQEDGTNTPTTIESDAPTNETPSGGPGEHNPTRLDTASPRETGCAPHQQHWYSCAPATRAPRECQPLG